MYLPVILSFCRHCAEDVLGITSRKQRFEIVYKYISIVWYGMLCSGAMLCGVVWYGSVRYGTVWFGVVWCVVLWCGVVWYGTVWFGLVWCGMVWHGVVWYCMVLVRGLGLTLLSVTLLLPDIFFSVDYCCKNMM